MWLTLQRNPKFVEGGKLPYFRLSIPPAQDGGQWQEVGAAWKAKSGKPGLYALKLADGVRLVIEQVEAPPSDNTAD